MSTSWKAAESRIGIWFGAKGINKSGRIPLSGGGSGTTRSDSPHRSIFVESKRDKSYHSVIKLWRSHKKIKKFINIQLLPTVDDNKIIDKTSDIWCIYNLDFENVVNSIKNDIKDIILHDWCGNYPRALTLYQQAISIKNSTVLDRKKEIVCCSLVYHGSPGFWIIINKNDIVKCWDLILEERKHREILLSEEQEFKESK